jgi:nicotinamide-nucleotide amidase
MSADRITRLAAALGRLAKRRAVMIATAESCTGGGVAEAITRIAGSSEWFDRGFVTYSNAAKQGMLGVRAATLAAHGAVSEPVARQMALGALRKSDAHIAVAITGIAGPGGGTPEKPVGLVCFAWAKAGEAATHSMVFEGNRQAVRAYSVAVALEGLAKLLK